MEKKIIKTAKELFDAEVKVSGAKYIDEVADIHYYYVENEDNAHLYMADEVNKSYDLAIFEKAHVFIKAHIFEYMEAMKGMLENDKAQILFDNVICGVEHDFQYLHNFCYYCDFLMQNTKLAIDGRSFKDEYEEVEEEKTETFDFGRMERIDVFNSMLSYLRGQVIEDIKARFNKGQNIEEEIHGWESDYFNNLDLNNGNRFRLEKDSKGDLYLRNGQLTTNSDGSSEVIWHNFNDTIESVPTEELFYILRTMC